MSMHVVRNPVSLRKLVALDERVHQARARLQRTTEADPSLERRVQTLLRLTKDRDRAMSGDDPFFPPAA